MTSPFLASDKSGLTGLWFVGQKNYAEGLSNNCQEKNTKVFDITRKWLDLYFTGIIPNFMPDIHLMGSTFRLEVWEELLKIPYGQVKTYSEIAEIISEKKGIAKMSARAVGNAIAHNPISIIVPCHRVIGKNGNLTGYAAGMDKKIKLLNIEKFNNLQ